MLFLKRKQQMNPPPITIPGELSAIAIARSERKQALFAFQRALCELKTVGEHLDRAMQALKNGGS